MDPQLKNVLIAFVGMCLAVFWTISMMRRWRKASQDEWDTINRIRPKD